MQSDTRQVPVSAPCPFNAMCSCKTTPSALLQRDAGDADADDAGDQQTVSCVGVPFATLPGAFLFFLGFPWKWKWKKWKCPNQSTSTATGLPSWLLSLRRSESGKSESGKHGNAPTNPLPLAAPCNRHFHSPRFQVQSKKTWKWKRWKWKRWKWKRWKGKCPNQSTSTDRSLQQTFSFLFGSKFSTSGSGSGKSGNAQLPIFVS